MARTLFTNISIFDGTGSKPFAGEVLIEDNRIKQIAKNGAHIDAAGAEIVDGGGGTLMPGMALGHCHFSFPISLDRHPKGGENFLVRALPVEKQTLIAAHNANVAMDYGFTSAYSAGGSSYHMEAILRDEINEGWIPGPRLIAGGTESVTDAYELSVNQSNDVEAVRNYVKKTAEVGADLVKFILSGPGFMVHEDVRSMYTDEQLAEAQRTAKECDVWLSGHARPTETIKQALKFGFRVIYHCDQMDDEALDMMDARKAEIFIGPTIAWSVAACENTTLPQAQRDTAQRQLDMYRKNVARMRGRGIRVMPDGDYGFPPIPHGNYARDLEGFVKYLDREPADVLMSVTKWGGELMDMGDELGLVKENYLADLLLIKGDPTKNISLLRDKNNILMVMKDGKYHRAPPMEEDASRRAAAE